MDRRRRLVIVGVLALQALVLVAVVLGRPDGTPRGTAVALVAPPIVGAVVADRIADDHVDTTVVTRSTETSALEDLRSGEVEAIVVVDLATDGDRLLLSPTNGQRLDDGMTDAVRVVTDSLGRSLAVERVEAPVMNRGLVAALVIGSALAGFAAALVAAWRRGPSEDRARGGALRTTVLAAASVAGGLVVAVAGAVGGGSFLLWWVLGGLLIGSGAAATSALLGLLGAPGAGVSTALFALTAAPLLLAGHVLLLAEPWATVLPWLPLGAGLDLGTALSIGGTGSPRSWLVLVAWVGLATATTVVARVLRVRATFGVLTDS